MHVTKSILGGGVIFRVLNIKPTTPKLNDIYIDTTTAISKWYITNTAPTNPNVGDVYFTLVTDSDIAPNLTDNVQVYLDKCWQWSGSAWVRYAFEWFDGYEWVNGFLPSVTTYLISNAVMVSPATQTGLIYRTLSTNKWLYVNAGSTGVINFNQSLLVESITFKGTWSDGSNTEPIVTINGQNYSVDFFNGSNTTNVLTLPYLMEVEEIQIYNNTTYSWLMFTDIYIN